MSSITFDEAFGLLVEQLKYPARSESQPAPSGMMTQGFDCWLPNLIWHYGQRRGIPFENSRTNEAQKIAFALPFYDAAAELCRIGVLRMGRQAGLGLAQAMATGEGYSLTSYGREWVGNHPDPIPRDPGQFLAVLEPFAPKLGLGFMQRSAEAIRCYRSANYLAACVMCGAATESILLALATAKTGDEAVVLTAYSAGGGRTKVLNLIIGKATGSARDALETFIRLAAIWRDEAGHGQYSEIQEPQANLSLLQLVRFAQFAHSDWVKLTAPNAKGPLTK